MRDQLWSAPAPPLRYLGIYVDIDIFEYIVSTANIIGAFAQVFFGNSSSKLASTWFGDGERALSTALGTLAMPIGCIAGFIVPAEIISEADLINPKEGREHFAKYLFIQNIVATIAAVPLILLVRAKPPSPPSISEAVNHGN
jgi:sugar phosphate permease